MNHYSDDQEPQPEQPGLSANPTPYQIAPISSLEIPMQMEQVNVKEFVRQQTEQQCAPITPTPPRIHQPHAALLPISSSSPPQQQPTFDLTTSSSIKTQLQTATQNIKSSTEPINASSRSRRDRSQRVKREGRNEKKRGGGEGVDTPQSNNMTDTSCSYTMATSPAYDMIAFSKEKLRSQRKLRKEQQTEPAIDSQVFTVGAPAQVKLESKKNDGTSLGDNQHISSHNFSSRAPHPQPPPLPSLQTDPPRSSESALNLIINPHHQLDPNTCDPTDPVHQESYSTLDQQVPEANANSNPQTVSTHQPIRGHSSSQPVRPSPLAHHVRASARRHWEDEEGDEDEEAVGQIGLEAYFQEETEGGEEGWMDGGGSGGGGGGDEVEEEMDEEDKRIEILKKIQVLCQDEDMFVQFEKILKDYEEKGTIVYDSSNNDDRQSGSQRELQSATPSEIEQHHNNDDFGSQQNLNQLPLAHEQQQSFNNHHPRSQDMLQSSIDQAHSQGSQKLDFPSDYTYTDLRNVFDRLSQQPVDTAHQESQSGQTSRQNKQTGVAAASKSGNKRFEALYYDFRDRQLRQEIVQKIVNKQTKKQLTRAVGINAKSRKLAYQKLEKDIDRAIQILLQAKNDLQKGTSSVKQSRIHYISEVMTLKETSQLLNMLNVFRIIPNKECQKPSKQQPSSSLSTTNHHTKQKKSLHSLQQENRKLLRESMEEEFLFKFWVAICPEFNSAGDYGANLSNVQQCADHGNVVPVKIVSDFLKLIFDPYLAVKKDDVYKQRVELTAEFLIELRKLSIETKLQQCLEAGIPPPMSLPNSEDLFVDGTILAQVQDIFEGLNELTSNFLAFRMARNAIKIPTQHHIRTQMQINKDLTFKPKINEQSKRIDREAVQNYENQHSVEFLLGQQTSTSGYVSRPASTLTKIKEKSININPHTHSVGFKGTSEFQSSEIQQLTFQEHSKNHNQSQGLPDGGNLSYQEQAEQMYQDLQKVLQQRKQQPVQYSNVQLTSMDQIDPSHSDLDTQMPSVTQNQHNQSMSNTAKTRQQFSGRIIRQNLQNSDTQQHSAELITSIAIPSCCHLLNGSSERNNLSIQGQRGNGCATSRLDMAQQSSVVQQFLEMDKEQERKQLNQFGRATKQQFSVDFTKKHKNNQSVMNLVPESPGFAQQDADTFHNATTSISIPQPCATTANPSGAPSTTAVPIHVSETHNFFEDNQDWSEWKDAREEQVQRIREEAKFNFGDYQRYLGDLGRENIVKADKANHLKRVELMMDKQRQRDEKVQQLAMIQKARQDEHNTFMPKVNKRPPSTRRIQQPSRERTILYDVCNLNVASQKNQIIDKGALDPNAPQCFEKSGKKYARTDVKHAMTVHERLLTWGKQQQKNRELISRCAEVIKEEKDLEECTFKPDINKKTLEKPKQPFKKSDNAINSLVNMAAGSSKFLERQKMAKQMRDEKQSAFQKMGRLSRKKNSHGVQATTAKLHQRSNPALTGLVDYLDHDENDSMNVGGALHQKSVDVLSSCQQPMSDLINYTAGHSSSMRQADDGGIMRGEKKNGVKGAINGDLSGQLVGSSANPGTTTSKPSKPRSAIGLENQTSSSRPPSSSKRAPHPSTKKRSLKAPTPKSRPASPLFDIELNIDEENTINLTVAKGEDYRLKLIEVCDRYNLDQDAKDMLMGVVTEYVHQGMYVQEGDAK